MFHNATRYQGGTPRKSHQDSEEARRLRVFTKLLKDGDAEMSNIHQAERFLEGMGAHDYKGKLLMKLTDSRDHGLKRVEDVLTFCGSPHDVELCLIGLLRNIMTDETSRPVYVRARNHLLMSIFKAPRLMESLVEWNIAMSMSSDSAGYLCRFLVEASKAFVEARQSESIKSLARALRERGDVELASQLCALLMIDTLVGHSTPNKKSQKQKSVACWVTDLTPPGNRHDNDHLNYRDIQIEPTVDELVCPIRSWLPLVSGDNAYIPDPETRVLDNNFRLLRDDAVRSMKEHLADERGSWKNARVIDLHVESPKKRADVCFLVKCDSRQGGNPNWERSRALSHGAVVAFCRRGMPKMMATITIRESDVNGEWLHATGGPVIGVRFEEKSFDKALAYLNNNSVYNNCIAMYHKKLKEGQKTRDSARQFELIEQINQLNDKLESFDMVEVSSSFFSYQPVLKAIQSMTNLPFPEELCKQGRGYRSNAPTYLPSELVISLPTSSGSTKEFVWRAELWSSKDIAARTTLDLSQADAIHHTFTSRVALIQGPPGTGKTFIGALLANTIRRNTDESILCICFTNHALDQFLEHLLDANERRIVRIGGRSKSEKLDPYRLRELARTKASSSSDDKRAIKQIDARLYRQKEMIDDLLTAMKMSVGWKEPEGGMESLFLDNYPDYYHCFTLPNQKDGFRIIGAKSNDLKEDYLWNCWVQGDPFPDIFRLYLPHFPTCFETLWACSLDARMALLDGWRRELLGDQKDNLHNAIKEFTELISERQAVQQQRDLEVLSEARVIGVTTTGAAQYKDLLSLKGAGIVIIEEAGEVLEAHVLSALQADATKHLILIGDHQQLRPKVDSYELTTVSRCGYNLDCSLFERLVLSGQPSVSLGMQHRMRPEISEFIRKQTYQFLQDHPSTQNFPDVKGVLKNVLFIDHSFPEDGIGNLGDAQSERTKTNRSEAELCVEMVRFFLLQGYSADQVVILTPYLGQLLIILQLVRDQLKEATAFVSEKDMIDLENMNEDAAENAENIRSKATKSVRCSSIDNFQGEEADVVIISLVRSNPSGNIGFLKEEQRVNVLMSRARYGMFIVGNSSTLRSSPKGRHVWRPILEAFEEYNRLQNGLPTLCQLHPDDAPLVLSSTIDFRKYRPNGGCNRKCNYRMDCGHACPLMCHPFDRQHNTVQRDCCEPCRRIPPECHLLHRCKRLCKDECGPCQTTIENVRLNCGHVLAQARCHDTRNDKALEILTRSCKQLVKHTFSKCGHILETSCGNAQSETPWCPGKCKALVERCNHPCARRCGECGDGTEHKCDFTCERPIFCGHICGQPCDSHEGGNCPPCKDRCCVTCSHSRCPKKCHVPCAPCVEACDWVCEHEGACKLVCGAPCSRLPCNKRCTKKLKCGHRCPTVCGEPCPNHKYCKNCGNQKNFVVDMIGLTTYEEHDVTEDPIVVLPCRHFYAISTLDRHLSMDQVYKKCNSNFVAVEASLETADITEKPRTCPDCRSLIHSVRRYGRILRLSELRSLERKHSMAIEHRLLRMSKLCESNDRDSVSLIKTLKEVEKESLNSPMNKVYEACAKREVFDAPKPPTRLLLRTMQLLAGEYSNISNATANCDNSKAARDTFARAIALAEESKSLRTGAKLRLQLCSHLLKLDPLDDSSKNEVKEHLQLVVSLRARFPDLASEAKQIWAIRIQSVEQRRRDMVDIIKAMNTEGYNYGTSWSEHWYECPNGHPYFIGNCGGAMQESTCNECGAAIGGGNHSLNQSNRVAGGLVGELLRSLRL